MGGNIIIYFAMNYPEMVEKLIIVDGAINNKNGNGNAIVSLALNNDLIKRWGVIGLSTYFTKENFGKSLKSAYFYPEKVTETDLNNYYLPLETNGWQDSLLAISRDGIKNTLPKELSLINNKTLIIWGRNDPWISIDEGKKLNQEIVGSKFIEIPNSGHLPMEEGSDVFNASLEKFLSENK
jgi:pimeloyl-ACP methyl ester carboxylesterase